jgi:tetratricopeptide (TPR) repeat protein
VKRLLLALLLWTPGWAAPPEESAAYSRANSAFYEQKYALSRELTEKLLKAEPNNYAALYLLGRIYHYGEGSIPRAYYCYSRSRQLIQKQFGKPQESPSQALYGTLLVDLGEAAQQLEHYQEAMQLIDLHDQLYPAEKHTARKGWPLLKLGRFEEARDLMLKLVDDPAHASYRGHALNNLGNIEFESDNMQKSYEYFAKIVGEVEGSYDVDPVYWCNAGEACRDLLRYDECEKLLLESTKHFNPYTYSDPWGFLAELYAAEGRMPEALQALKRMQAWRISGSAQVSQNKWAECYAHAGSVLLQMGYDSEALTILERLVRRQDRNSSISTPATLVEARLVFLYVQALQRNAQRVREKLSYSNWKETPPLLFQLWQWERQMARERQRVANLVATHTGIEGFLQPYGARALDQPSLAPASWSCFGTGATIASARRSLASKKPEMEARRPYLLAILGEAYLHDWNSKQAQITLEEALVQLPGSEVKLRNRCQAVLARTLSQQGRHSEALHYLQTLMDSDPSQLRACQLGLPISIESDGGRAANQARNWLYNSPRCQRANGAFVLKLQGDTLQVEGQLFGPDGTLSGSFKGQPRRRADDAARSFCQVFHAEAFAPIIDLSQSDIRSIDGSTGSARAGALQDLMK